MSFLPPRKRERERLPPSAKASRVQSRAERQGDEIVIEYNSPSLAATANLGPKGDKWTGNKTKVDKKYVHAS